MSLHVIEGTWEEIERRKSELIGHQLRVTIKREKTSVRQAGTAAKKSPASGATKRLIGFGAFKESLPSTEEYMREKRIEIQHEERNF